MAVQTAGLSTLGVMFAYGVETVAGEKPSTFNALERCNSISGIELPTENIDASALEDYVTKYIAGRQDSGGEWSVTFNYTAEVATQLANMISAYNTAKASNLKTWFEVYIPNATNGFFVVAQPPQVLPMPEFAQNELLTIDVTFAIENYKGELTAVVPTVG